MINLKSAAEIKQMEAACKISAQALAHAGKFMQEGVSTYEIDHEIYKFIVAACNYRIFPAFYRISRRI